MPTTIERVDANTVRLCFEIPASAFNEAVSKELRRRGGQMRVRGFRPGKAPLSILRNYIGGEVTAEVAGDMMKRSVGEAVQQHELRPAAPVKLEFDPHEPGQPLRFHATIEVHENPRDIDVEGLTAVRRVPAVDEADVDEQIDRLREVHARSVPIDPPRPARKGDIARIDYSIAPGGCSAPGASPPPGPPRNLAAKPLGSFRFDDKPGSSPVVREGVEVEVGAAHFLLDLAGVTLEGMTVGEEKTSAVAFPDEFVVGSLAGRKGTVAIKLQDLSLRRLPAVDDEFARDLGVEDLAALRAKVRAELDREAQAVADQEVDRALQDAVIERAAPSLAPTWVAERLREHEEAFQRLLGGRGDQLAAEQRAVLLAEAERRLRYAAVVGWLGLSKGLHATAEDVEAEVARIAESTGRPLAQIRAELARAGTTGIENDITERRVLAFLRAAARIEDGPPLPAAERRAARRGGRGAK